MQAVVAAGTGATPAAFYLGLCRLRSSMPLPAPHDDAAGVLFSTATTIVLHRFASLGLKSRIDAAVWLFLRVSLHRFPSLALKSRIDAAMEASGVLQAEPFFFAATEIRIGCGIPLSPRLLQAEPFFFAAMKNRIGRGESLQSQG